MEELFGKTVACIKENLTKIMLLPGIIYNNQND